MKFAIHILSPHVMTNRVAHNLINGAREHGDRILPVSGFHGPVRDADGVIIVGIGVRLNNIPSRTIYDAYASLGKRRILFDKSYTRSTKTYRVSIDDFQPVHYFNKWTRPNDRVIKFNVETQRARVKYKGPVVLDGMSQKYCDWHNLGNMVKWAEHTIEAIRQHTQHKIVYRPRPNCMPERLPRNADEVSTLPLEQEFERAFCIVSHAGNIGYDAVVSGVYHCALGPSIAKPVSRVGLLNLDDPLVPTEKQRMQWLCNVMYCQWHESELGDGVAWRVIREQLEGS